MNTVRFVINGKKFVSSKKNVITLHVSNLVGHHLVEDVVGPLEGLLRDDASLLKQVHLNIST